LHEPARRTIGRDNNRRCARHRLGLRRRPCTRGAVVDIDPESAEKTAAAIGSPAYFGRIGQAEYQTGMAIFLAGPESDYVVGQTFNVDAGQRMS